MKMLREKIYRESMNFKILSDEQLKNVFPEWESLIERIDNYHQWLKTARLDKRNLVEKQYNLMYENIYSILGGRGTGKTSVIFTLRNYIEENYPSDVVLPIVMPEVIPESGETLGWILASLENLVEQLSKGMEVKQQRSREIFYDCKNGDNPLRNIYDEVKELCYSRQMKTGGDSFSEEILKRERKNQSGYELSRKISEFWIRLIDAIKELCQDKLYNQDEEPLIYLIFDDVDLNPERALEICSAIIKYLSHPNLIIIMTADEELFYDVILNSMTYKMRNLAEYFKMGNSIVNGEECEKYCKKLRDTSSLYMGKIMPVSSRYTLKTFEECSQKQAFLLEDSEGKKQDLEHFLKEMVDNLIKKMYGDGKEAEGKNFLYYSQNKFISIYMIFFGNTSRQITDASLVINNFFKELCRMNGLKDYPDRYKKEYLKEKMREFVVDILRTRGNYWGNDDDIIQMSKNLIVSKQGTADIYIEYAYLQQLFSSEFKDAQKIQEIMEGEKIQENKIEQQKVIQKNISLFILMFFTENILLLINPLLKEVGMYGQRKRIHGHRYLVKQLDEILVSDRGEESLIRCENNPENLSKFLYTYQNVLENYFIFSTFNRYSIEDIGSYLYMVNRNKNEKITAASLEKYYWESPKWFRTVIPMIWSVYRNTFFLNRSFYVEYIKPLYRIPVYGKTISEFHIKVDSTLCKAICKSERKEVDKDYNYINDLIYCIEVLADLYMKVNEYRVLDVKAVSQSFNHIAEMTLDFKIKVLVEKIIKNMEKQSRLCLVSKYEINDFFGYITKKDREIKNLLYDREWGEEELWNNILREVDRIKMNLDIWATEDVKGKIIQTQDFYITGLSIVLESKIGFKEEFFEKNRVPYLDLYRTIKEVYTDKVIKNSVLSWDLKQIIKEDTESYIQYIKDLL